MGRGRTDWADEACQDYARRFRSRMKFEERRLRPEPFRGDVAAVRAAEGKRIVDALKAGDRLVALDERGSLQTTEALSEWVDGATRSGVKRLVFAIGGPYGHAPAVRDKAWKTLALSKMVLNHEIARLVLVEQLYRVNTLLWGGKYHH